VITALAAAATRSKTQVVLVEHHVATSVVSPSGRPGLFHPLLGSAMRAAYPRGDRVIGVSQAVLDETLRVSRLPASRGLVIPNPVVFDDLATRAEGPAGHPWLDEDGHEVVLGVGRLVAFKNFPLLVDAFAMLAARRPRARLIIIGDGAQRADLEAQVGRLDLRSRVAFVGHWQNPYPAIRRARAVAVTSHTEGLSTVLIEAMALGTPVVATDFASAREALPAGLVEPVAHTPEAVAAAIEDRFDNPGDIQGLEAHAAQFTAAPIARRYEELFLNMISDPRAAGSGEVARTRALAT
jgi:glycosyltransferase involved in cell wall biosynthesis